MIRAGVPSAQEDRAPREPAVRVHSPRRPLELLCRVLDLGVATVALMLLLPLMLLIAIAIRLDSAGPALFRQQRLGRSMKPFTVIKFRTMTHNASRDPHRRFVEALIAGKLPAAPAGGPRFKLSDDKRVTRVGHILRRTSLDELPQLVNVLRGEMSIVGPRPTIPYEVERYPPEWMQRFAVRPGITGLWQVSGRGELTYEEMIALDLEYVDRRSLLFNVWLMIRTVPAVFSTRGAS